jgi:hypothetical protein
VFSISAIICEERESIMRTLQHSTLHAEALSARLSNVVLPPLSRQRATSASLVAAALTLVTLLWPTQPALADFAQFGPALVGNTVIGSAGQGTSVAVSGDGYTMLVGGRFDNNSTGATWVYLRVAGGFTERAKLFDVNGVTQGSAVALSGDGMTAIVGGPDDNQGGNLVGAAWVWIRIGDGWTQQTKLIGTGFFGTVGQGSSVALSGDGNTAIVGGPLDNSTVGSAWVFTRSNGVWTQQQRLIGPIINTYFGSSVALSGDGNTAIVGGPGDGNGAGAAWVWTRSGGAWSVQTKLFGIGAATAAGQGTSVALSADGNTAILGGPFDNTNTGAAWVFTRSNGVWAQQGNKLVDNSTTSANQGSSVTLSADGNISLVGGPQDGGGVVGAAWAYRRTGGSWTQLGNKLVVPNTTSQLGSSVALSGDGSTALVGGPEFNNGSGAAWVFGQPNKFDVAATHDFNSDYHSDIAWRETGGATSLWLMSGPTVLQPLSFGVVPTNWQIVGQRDFNNDGRYDLLWRDNNTGTVAIWLLGVFGVLQTGSFGPVPGNWVITGTSDFNLDGSGDILWRDTSTGAVAIWLMNGVSVMQTGSLGTVPSNWVIAGNDGKGEIFWRDTNTGTLAIWQVYGFEVTHTANLGAVPLNWVIAGLGDFDGNGSTDILWRDTSTGNVAIWLMSGYQVLQTGSLGAVPGNWMVAQTGDFNNSGRSNILWRDSNTGTVAMWFVNGLQPPGSATVGTVGLDWAIQGLNSD